MPTVIAGIGSSSQAARVRNSRHRHTCRKLSGNGVRLWAR